MVTAARAWGHQYVSVNNQAIAPLGEAKSHGEAMRLIAAAMDLNHPALSESDEQIAAAALPEWVDLDQLKLDGWQKTPSPRPAADPGKKIRLAGSSMGPQPETPADMLRLLTPKGHFFMNTSFANMPRQRKAMKTPTLEVNAEDAIARRLVDGQDITVFNKQGSITTQIHISEAVRPGVVALPGKWWSHPTETGAVANFLSPSAWSPGGQPAYNDIFVDIAPAVTT